MKKVAASVILLAGCATPDSDFVAMLDPVSASVVTAAPRRAGTQESIKDLTLEQALALADEAHPEVAAARARVAAAEGRVLQAGRYPNPELVARMEVAPIRGRTAGEAEYVTGLGQRLPVGGRLSVASRVEELERERLLKDLEARRLEVRARVHAAFGAALYMEEAVKLYTDAVRTAGRGLEIVRARAGAGDALPEDVARSEVEGVKARLERDRAASVQEEALLALSAALGTPGLRVESVVGSLEAVLEVPALESLLAVLTTSPFVESGEAAVAVERAREELARAQAIPDINVELLYRRQEASRTDAFDAGLSVAIPFFDRNQGRIHEARADVATAEARARLTRNEIEHRARAAHIRLTRGMAQTRLLRDEVLPRSGIVLRGAEVRYGGGDMSLADLLPILRDLTLARLSYLEALREVFEAWSELRPFVRKD